jgi:GT2 family glycosyltransferase
MAGSRLIENSSMSVAERSAPSRPVRLGVVVAVRNESRWLDGLLESIRASKGAEHLCCIAAVDGRSEDETRAILEEWRSKLPALRILDNEKKVAPAGFNIGIRECLSAGAEAILIVSGHSRLHSGFFEEAQRVLFDPRASVVGCVLDYPAPETPFERASQAFVESRLGRRMRSYSRLATVTETEIATFPFVRREVFDRVGLFDEAMIRNQDIEFTARVRAAGFGVLTSPGLRCRYSPPTTLRRLIRQMHGNGYWVGQRWGAHGLRHFAPALFFGALGLTVGIASLRGAPWTAAAAILGGGYVAGLAITTLVWLPKIGHGAFWLPLAFFGAHAAYALGTMQGLVSKALERRDRASGRVSIPRTEGEEETR